MILQNRKNAKAAFYKADANLTSPITVQSLNNTTITLTTSSTTSSMQCVLGTSYGEVNTASYYPAYTSTVGYGLKINLICGSGTTEPALDDYCLESPFTSLIPVGWSSAPIYENDVITGRTFSKTLQNNTGDDITVSEIGIVGSNRTSSTAMNDSNTVLLERTVLDTPVTVANGETFTIQYVDEF